MSNEAPGPRPEGGPEPRQESAAEDLLRLEERELSWPVPDEPEWFADLADGLLGAEERRVREASLTEDEALRARYEAYLRTIAAVRGTAGAEVEPGRFLRARILGAWQEEQGAPVPVAKAGGRGVLFAFLGSIGVAAAGLVAIIALLENDPSTRPAGGAEGTVVDRYAREKAYDDVAKENDLPELLEGRWQADGDVAGKGGGRKEPAPSSEQSGEGPSLGMLAEGTRKQVEEAETEDHDGVAKSGRDGDREELKRELDKAAGEERLPKDGGLKGGVGHAGLEGPGQVAGGATSPVGPVDGLGFGQRPSQTLSIDNTIPRGTEKLVELIDELQEDQARYGLDAKDEARPAGRAEGKVMLLCFDLDSAVADRARAQLAPLELQRYRLDLARDRAEFHDDGRQGKNGGGGQAQTAVPGTPESPSPSPRTGGRAAEPTHDSRGAQQEDPGRERKRADTGVPTGGGADAHQPQAPAEDAAEGFSVGYVDRLANTIPAEGEEVFVLRARRSELLGKLVQLMAAAERTTQTRVDRDALVALPPAANDVPGKARRAEDLGERLPDAEKMAEAGPSKAESRKKVSVEERQKAGNKDGSDDFGLRGGGGGANDAPAPDPVARSGQEKADAKSDAKSDDPKPKRVMSRSRVEDPVIELHVLLRRLPARQPVPPARPEEPSSPATKPARSAPGDRRSAGAGPRARPWLSGTSGPRPAGPRGR
ncbi:MAG: hypothetical protein R3F30_01590 [Planctomycetota bacterium]